MPSEWLSELVDSLPALVCVCDGAGALLHSNRRFQEYSGFGKDELSFAGWPRFVHEDDIARAIRIWGRAMALKTSYACELRLRRADGQFRWHWSHSVPVSFPSADGLWLTTTFDIHEGQRREEAFVRYRAEAERLACTVTQELHEPIRSIVALGERLSAKYGAHLDEEGRQQVAELVERARQVDLVAFRLNGSARRRLHASDDGAEKIDLRWLVLETMRSLAFAAGKADVAFEVEPLPIVWGRRVEWLRLFRELLSNALQFAATPRAPISVSARRVSRSVWEFAVADRGIGVFANAADKIFDFRADDGFAGARETGLAACHRIVERNRGRIWYEPTHGGGATFFFTMHCDRVESTSAIPIEDSAGSFA